MPSSSYVPISNRGMVKGFRRQTLGGAVPLLLSKIIKHPVTGGALEEKPRSNIMVGQITKSIPTPVVESKSVGGELLNSLSKLKFGKGTKQSREIQNNIKFIY